MLVIIVKQSNAFEQKYNNLIKYLNLLMNKLIDEKVIGKL